ncbi:hypothetical protein K438DRAFT_653742 [Mycena galopus ATCC 62051]|nr:hypothetical protein K438DRAFT_653742 [Mycena galopus ATCC 62051]
MGGRGYSPFFRSGWLVSRRVCPLSSPLEKKFSALASLSALPPHLLAIRTRAEALDVLTPVVDALLDLLAALNTPTHSGAAPPLRALALIEALCAPPPVLDSPSSSPFDSPSPSPSKSAPAPRPRSTSARARKRPRSSRRTSTKTRRSSSSCCPRPFVTRARGFRGSGRGIAGWGLGLGLGSRRPHLPLGASAGAADITVTGADGLQTPTPTQPQPQSPFDGLTARRRACVRCGYTAAIRHFAFDSVQLVLESVGGGTGPPFRRCCARTLRSRC